MLSKLGIFQLPSILLGKLFGLLGIIKDWVIGNGIVLNLVYVAVLSFIVLSLCMSVKYDGKKSERKVEVPSSLEMGMRLFGLASFLAIPSVLLYLFDGMAEEGELLYFAPKPFSELLLHHKVILISFGIYCLVFFLVSYCIQRDYFYFWNSMFMDGCLLLLCVGFMLFERGVTALFPQSSLIRFAFTTIHTFLQFYAYIGLVVMPVLAILSPFLLLIPGVKNATPSNRPTAEQAYADSLDERERRTNSLLGIGELTNDEAYLSGRISIDEWAPGSIPREQKMEKFNKK